MSLLITRPRYDKLTHYFFYWAQLLINEANRKSLKIFDLSKEKAVRKTVESYLAKQSPKLVIFNGHGNDVCIAGQYNEELISAGDNEYFLKEKCVYVRACSAGKILGPKIIEAGATGFIGYKKPFIFWRDENSFHNPLLDEFAKPFLECSNQVGISLIKGHSVKEAHDDSIKIYLKKITEMLTSESYNTFILPELIGNMKNQVCYEGK